MLQGDLLAPFLFIIEIDYVSRRYAEGFGYLAHKGNNQDNKVGLEINVQNTEKMRLNQSSNLSPSDPLTKKGQTILFMLHQLFQTFILPYFDYLL